MATVEEVLSNPAIEILDSTKLQDFESCRRYGMFSHIFGWTPSRPNNHLEFGHAWHLAHEHLLNAGYSAATVNEAYQLFEDYYRSIFDLSTDEIYFPKIPMVVLTGLIKYVNEYKDIDSKYATIHTEVAGSVPILKGHRLHFKLDSIVYDTVNGYYSSREHKTGSRLSNAWREQWINKIQTGTYQHVLMCMYPREKVEGITINGAIFTSGIKKAGKIEFERVPVKRSDAMMEVWLRHVTRLSDEIVNGILALREDFDRYVSDDILELFPMNTEQCTGYSGCIFKDFCTSWTNPLRYIDTMPSGFIERFWNPIEERDKMNTVIDF